MVQMKMLMVAACRITVPSNPVETSSLGEETRHSVALRTRCSKVDPVETWLVPTSDLGPRTRAPDSDLASKRLVRNSGYLAARALFISLSQLGTGKKVMRSVDDGAASSRTCRLIRSPFLR